jgi:hypothetical protein
VASPQDLLRQLKMLRPEILTTGVVARSVTIDVLTAGIIRAPENLRMDEKRSKGAFTMPRYVDDIHPATDAGLPDRTACLLDLSCYPDADSARTFLFSQLHEIDSVIEEDYRDDIKSSGVRVGGMLFPLKIRLPGEPDRGGWETADCYGRTLFVQDAEDISPQMVLRWLTAVPTTAHELRSHPLQQRRTSLLAIKGKIDAGTPLTSREEESVARAVMPATKLVLAVDGIGLSESRRRAVAQHHIERPKPFTSDTVWQIRSEAVLDHAQDYGTIRTIPGYTPETFRSWLSHGKLPAGIFRDDVAALACATLLPKPGTPEDRIIATALRTRGVIGKERTKARSFVAAHVIARTAPVRPGRLSALERALRSTSMRDFAVDVRPIETILTDARAELAAIAEDRSRGTHLDLGPATKQLVLRAAYYLIFGPADAVLHEDPTDDDNSPASAAVLGRSEHGAPEGQGQEPATLLAGLAATAHGLEQLAQAILDGRNGFAARRLDAGEKAGGHLAPPTAEEQLTPSQLRTLALSSGDGRDSDRSANGRLAGAGQRLRKHVAEVGERLAEMEGYREEGAVLSVVNQRGWRDPSGEIITGLKEASEKLSTWTMRHEILNGSDDTGNDRQ